jgi:hypothetical protein
MTKRNQPNGLPELSDLVPKLLKVIEINSRLTRVELWKRFSKRKGGDTFGKKWRNWEKGTVPNAQGLRDVIAIASQNNWLDLDKVPVEVEPLVSFLRFTINNRPPIFSLDGIEDDKLRSLERLVKRRSQRLREARDALIEYKDEIERISKKCKS